MSLKYLNKDAIFKCNCGINGKFKVNDVKKVKINKKSILTTASKLTIIAPAQCKNKPNPEVSGTFLPCTIKTIKWFNFSNKNKFNLENLLTEDSCINCAFGGLLSVDKTSLNKITVSKENKILNINNVSLREIKEEDIAKQDIKKDVNKEMKLEMYDEFKEYALCSLSCENPEECEYINASSEVNNDSDKLFKNFSNDITEKYIKKENSIITLAAHHIIPGNEVFKKHKGLVKLANIYDYDINNKQNCILLPCKVESLDESVKIGPFDVMSMLGKQWHCGHHRYNISKVKFIENNSQGEILNYEEAVDRELNKIEDYLKNNNVCFSKNYENIKFKKNKETPKKYTSTNFKERMNYRSEKIKNKLNKFKENSKESNPFYVSAIAYQYAFSIPISKKFIVVFKENNEVIFNKYRFVIKNKKNNNKDIKFIQLKDSKRYRNFNKANLENIILFCENINNFILDADLERKEIFEIKNIKIINNLKENLLYSLEKNETIKKIENFLDKEEGEYIYPKKMQMIRLKQLNLYLETKRNGG